MSIKIFIGGDVVLTNSNCFTSVTDELSDFVKSHDLALCNFEAPIDFTAAKPEVKIGPTISQCAESVEILKNSGFNLFLLANNHIMDYGRTSLLNTTSILDEQGIDYTGISIGLADTYSPYLYEKGDFKIAVINCCENGFGACINEKEEGYTWIFDSRLKNKIRVLKEKKYFILMLPHAGAEEFNLPLPEWRTAYKEFIDLGVDIVVGNHPHLIQGKEIYNGKIIYYSLGNLMFNDTSDIHNPYNPESLVLSIEIDDEVKIEELFTEFMNGKLQLNNKKELLKEFIVNSNKLKNEEEYLKEVNSFCEIKYKEIYKQYYLNVSNVNKGTFMGLIKTIFKLILKKDIINPYWLFHNIAIETHSWIVQRAIRKGYKL